jgi:hypothetical protein
LTSASLPVGIKRRGIYLLLDIAVVASFILIGRDSHNESVGAAEVVRTGAPFVLALAWAWLTPLVRRTPWRVGSGIIVGLVTTGLGLFFRSVLFGEGISGLFPVVTAGYLIGLMIIPRLIAFARSRTRAARAI